MKEMALRAKTLVSSLPDDPSGDFFFEPNKPGDSPFTVGLHTIWAHRVEFLDSFASTMAKLQSISEKELARTPLSPADVQFLQTLLEAQDIGYTHVRTYSGWYPQLFYENERAKHDYPYSSPSDAWDALVTDVHTDPSEPFVGDPGGILHEAVGNVHMLMIAVDCGPGDTAVYAGPVLSHYEFELGPTTRKTDSQWKTELINRTIPAQPDWTRCYLVPGP
jgi:hypothetical protein